MVPAEVERRVLPGVYVPADGRSESGNCGAEFAVPDGVLSVPADVAGGGGELCAANRAGDPDDPDWNGGAPVLGSVCHLLLTDELSASVPLPAGSDGAGADGAFTYCPGGDDAGPDAWGVSEILAWDGPAWDPPAMVEGGRLNGAAGGAVGAAAGGFTGAAANPPDGAAGTAFHSVCGEAPLNANGGAALPGRLCEAEANWFRSAGGMENAGRPESLAAEFSRAGPADGAAVLEAGGSDRPGAPGCPWRARASPAACSRSAGESSSS